MASNPPPSSNSSSIPPKFGNNNNYHHNHHHNNQHQCQNDNCWSSTRNSYRPSPTSKTGAGAGGAGGPSATGGTAYAFSSFLGSLLCTQKSRLVPEFVGRQSTLSTTDMHFGCPKIIPKNHPHTQDVEEALHWLLQAGNDIVAIKNAFLNYEHKLWGCNDYIYLLKNFGNTGHFLQASECYGIAMRKENENENKRANKGKLTSAMIDTLSKLGKIEYASRLFEKARHEGYGNTVDFCYVMINAFGRNECFHDAINLFRSMNSWDLEPDLTIYNALIDAGVKGKADFDIIVKFFYEMVANDLVPDRVTYNSLISACASKGMWEWAQNLLSEMDQKGIDRDLNTYNAYLDTLCKGGQMELARMVMKEMSGRKILPNVVTYSIMMDGYTKANHFEDALNLYDEMKHQCIG